MPNKTCSSKNSFNGGMKSNCLPFKGCRGVGSSMIMTTTIGSKASFNEDLCTKKPMNESMRSTRYRLNQYYLNKFNEDKAKRPRAYSPSYLNHFSQDSFLLEKMLNSSRHPSESNTEAKYNFKKNLYDDRYNERLQSFNCRRKSPSDSMALVRTNEYNFSRNEGIQQQSQPQEYLTPHCDYQRSNLSTYVPKRKARCVEEWQKTLNCPYHNNTLY